MVEYISFDTHYSLIIYICYGNSPLANPSQCRKMEAASDSRWCVGEYTQESPVLKLWLGIKGFLSSSIDLETDSSLIVANDFSSADEVLVS